MKREFDCSKIREENTELQIGKMRITVRSIFSDSTSETALDKARKLILFHAFDQPESEDTLAMCENQSEHVT